MQPKKSGASNGTGAEKSRSLRSVVIATDLSRGSERLLNRVALLPLADAVAVTLLHVVPGGLRPADERTAKRDARNALDTLADKARRLRALLPGAATVETVVRVGTAAAEIAACATVANAELLVIGRAGGSALRDAFLGSTAERVVRRAQLPVLVVRLSTRGIYCRPAIALDVDPVAEDALCWLLRLLPPPRPEVAVIHGFHAPHLGFVYPSLVGPHKADITTALRKRAEQGVTKVLNAAIKRANVHPTDVPSWQKVIREGSPRLVIKQALGRREIDLLVLGTRGSSGLTHLFLGTVAGEALRDAACDVLLVPPLQGAPEPT